MWLHDHISRLNWVVSFPSNECFFIAQNAFELCRCSAIFSQVSVLPMSTITNECNGGTISTHIILNVEIRLVLDQLLYHQYVFVILHRTVQHCVARLNQMRKKISKLIRMSTTMRILIHANNTWSTTLMSACCSTNTSTTAFDATLLRARWIGVPPSSW